MYSINKEKNNAGHHFAFILPVWQPKHIGMSMFHVVNAWEYKCKDSFEACHEILFY